MGYTGTIEAGGFTTTGLVTAYGVRATAIVATGEFASMTTTLVNAAYVSTTGANVAQTLQAGRVMTPYLTVPGCADISATGIYFTGSLGIAAVNVTANGPFGYVDTRTLNAQYVQASTAVETPYFRVPGYVDIGNTGIWFTGGSGLPNAGVLNCTTAECNL